MEVTLKIKKMARASGKMIFHLLRWERMRAGQAGLGDVRVKSSVSDMSGTQVEIRDK